MWSFILFWCGVAMRVKGSDYLTLQNSQIKVTPFLWLNSSQFGMQSLTICFAGVGTIHFIWKKIWRKRSQRGGIWSPMHAEKHHTEAFFRAEQLGGSRRLEPWSCTNGGFFKRVHRWNKDLALQLYGTSASIVQAQDELQQFQRPILGAWHWIYKKGLSFRSLSAGD